MTRLPRTELGNHAVVPSRDELLVLVRSGRSFEEIAERYGIHPGLAYMIVTGLPADGSDVLPAQDLAGREGLLEGSSQHLANPSTEVPTHDETVEHWIKGRVSSDPPMIEAGARRSAEPPEVQAKGETDDVISVLGWEHNQVKFLVEQLQAIPGVRVGGSASHQQRRVSIVDMVRLRLSMHETAEEEHLWPAVRRALPDGDAVADEALQQEDKGKGVLQSLDGLRGDDERFDELVEELVGALRRHVAFEDKVFLRLADALGDDARAKIGRKVARAERHAPTRPHPHAPDTPPAIQVAGAPAAALDRLRDATGRRPAERHGKDEESAD